MLLTGDIVAKPISLLIVYMLSQSLSAEEFGDYNYFITYMGLIAIFINPFTFLSLRDYRLNNETKYKANYLFIVIPFVSAFLIVSSIFNSKIFLLPSILFTLTFVIVAVIRNYLNSNEKYRAMSAVGVALQVCIFSTLFISIKFSASTVMGFITNIYGVTSIFFGIVFLILVRKKKIVWTKSSLVNIDSIKNTFFLIAYRAVLPIIAFTGMFFVEQNLTGYDLGMYSLSLKFYMLSLFALAPMQNVFRIKQLDVTKNLKISTFIRENFKKVLQLSSLVYCITIFGTIILTKLFFSSYTASLPVSLVLVSTSFISYVSIPFCFLFSTGNFKEMFMIAVVALLSNILICSFATAKYGAIAPALGTLISQSILNIGNALVSYKKYGQKDA